MTDCSVIDRYCVWFFPSFLHSLLCVHAFVPMSFLTGYLVRMLLKVRDEEGGWMVRTRFVGCISSPDRPEECI